MTARDPKDKFDPRMPFSEQRAWLERNQGPSSPRSKDADGNDIPFIREGGGR